jgi:hypothetical protein
MKKDGSQKQTLLTLLALTLVIAGCATTSQQEVETPPKHAKRVQVAVYDSTTRPKTAHMDVYDMKPPQRPYKSIALLTCEGTPKEEAAMTTAILYRARMMGTQEEGGFIMGSHGGFGGGSNTRCVFRARAIVYEDK